VKPRVDRKEPPVNTLRTLLCLGALAPLSFPFTSAHAQGRLPVERIGAPISLPASGNFRIAPRPDDGVTMCQPNKRQHVREYDGSLGQSRAFVDTHKNPVGRIRGTTPCSGTLIARDLFLTAAHCLSGGAPLALDVEFNAEKLPGTTTQEDALSRHDVLEVVEDGFRQSQFLDYAILRLSGTPGDRFGVAELEPLRPAEGHLITVIQHPKGEAKQVDVGHILRYDAAELYMLYADLSTDGGTSGAGILDDEGRLVGVHRGRDCAESFLSGGLPIADALAHSPRLRSLSPDSEAELKARIRRLEVRDMDKSFGDEGDALSTEAVVSLEDSARTLGFTLRTGTDEEAHESMLELVRKAYLRGRPLRFRYTRDSHRTGHIVHVTRD
jgi:hypothetical protein